MASSNDFFLSYAWEDNDKPSSGLPSGWVDRFLNSLLRELRDVWWQHIKYFRDCQKIKVGSIADAVDVALQDSICFVCLISNSYLTSDWCVEELARMHAAIETDPLLPPEKVWQRLVPVLLAPLPRDRLGRLQQLRYAKAFKTAPGDGGDWELLEPSERGDGSRMVREVAIMVKEVLWDIRGKGGPLYGQKGKFFMSVSPDLDFNRLGLAASFEECGFPVVPGETLPTNEEAYTKRVTELLSGSRASFHGFGRTLPERVGELVPLHYEFELAKTACASNKLARSIVWIPKDWDTTNKKQAAYVQKVRHDEKKPANVAIYQVSFPELKDVIRVACGEFDSQQAPLPTRRQVYLLYRLCDESDAHLHAIAEWLKNVCNQIGKTVLTPLFAGDPAHIRQHDLSAREESSATLVYCGLKAEKWADSQYELLKSSALGPAGRIFYITPGTIDFAPPPDNALSFESGTTFDAAMADEKLRALLRLG